MSEIISLTGAWFDPENPGRGLAYFGNDQRGAGSIYLHNSDGSQAWYVIQTEAGPRHNLYQPKRRDDGSIDTSNLVGYCDFGFGENGFFSIAVVVHAGVDFSPPPPNAGLIWVSDKLVRLTA